MRTKRFLSGLVSSYLAIGVNVGFTIASVPLALHYLSREEFGIWALVTQISGYLMLLEFGMSGSVARFLADQDDAESRLGDTQGVGQSDCRREVDRRPDDDGVLLRMLIEVAVEVLQRRNDGTLATDCGLQRLGCSGIDFNDDGHGQLT